MHVLIIPSEFFVPAHSPLAGIFQYDQAVALRDAGIRVGVVAPELRPLRRLLHAPDWRRRGFQRDTVAGFPVLRQHGWHWSIPPARIGQAMTWLRAGRRLVRRYLREVGRPDVVHAHNARFAGMLASWVRREYGIPYVLTEHSSVFQLGEVKRREVRRIREAYADASVRFVVSEALGESVAAAVGDPALRLEVLPNLLDPLFEKIELAPAAPGTGHGGPFRFLNVAELNANKRQGDLLRAFARVSRERNCTLRIVGDGPLRHELATECLRLGITDRTTFTGRLDRRGVLREMLACDAFVLSSARETFGVVVAEALACGKPVVATASGGPNAMVTPTNGFLVPPAAVDALEEGLARMIDEHSRFDPHVIRQGCMDRYGARRIVRRLLDAYREVAA